MGKQLFKVSFSEMYRYEIVIVDASLLNFMKSKELAHKKHSAFNFLEMIKNH